MPEADGGWLLMLLCVLELKIKIKIHPHPNPSPLKGEGLQATGESFKTRAFNVRKRRCC